MTKWEPCCEEELVGEEGGRTNWTNLVNGEASKRDGHLPRGRAGVYIYRLVSERIRLKHYSSEGCLRLARPF